MLPPYCIAVLSDFCVDPRVTVHGHGEESPSLFGAAGGNSDSRARASRLAGTFIEELCSFTIAFHLRHVADVVQRECVVGVEGIGLAKILIGGTQVIAVYRRNSAQVEFRYLLGNILGPAQMITQGLSILLRHFADRLSPPDAIGGYNGSRVGTRSGSFVVILQCLLGFAL